MQLYMMITSILVFAAVVCSPVFSLPSSFSSTPTQTTVPQINVNDGVTGIPEEPKARLDNLKYFEGDIIISQEMIESNYGNPNRTEIADGHTDKRSVVRDRYYRWPNGVVYYSFHTSLKTNARNIIEGAIQEISRNTCLQFQQRSRGYYILFTRKGAGCASYIGWVGGKQTIHLPFGCLYHGIVVHEICHALGMWHEQSRPDRNLYVRIVPKNIRSYALSQYMVRNDLEVDYHGETYDYGSIMHYGRKEFSNGRGDTMVVANMTEYRRQGSPKLGQDVGLSPSDVKQLNRMYSCPESGVVGVLNFYIKYGRGLPDTDTLANTPDPYVAVTAVDNRNRRVTRRTPTIRDTVRPNWSTLLSFGGRSWQYFEMSVWDADSGYDDQMILRQPFPINPGYHSNIKHCRDRRCSARVYFDYQFLPDGNECSPNPCIRGTCDDLISRYRCNCPAGYEGSRCERISGGLP